MATNNHSGPRDSHGHPRPAHKLSGRMLDGNLAPLPGHAPHLADNQHPEYARVVTRHPKPRG
jgi:hypothetical protein